MEAAEDITFRFDDAPVQMGPAAAGADDVPRRIGPGREGIGQQVLDVWLPTEELGLDDDDVRFFPAGPGQVAQFLIRRLIVADEDGLDA